MAIEQFCTIPTYVRHKKGMRKGDESMKKAPPAEGHNSKSIHPFTSIDRSIEREEEDLQLFSEVVLDLISSTGWKFDGIEAVERDFLRDVHLTNMSENRANSESDNSISIRLITMNDISIES